jgi:uncharacterized protein
VIITRFGSQRRVSNAFGGAIVNDNTVARHVLPSWQDQDVRVVVISDTHAPRFWKACPTAVARHLDGADLILHAGDVCTARVLDDLAGLAPVRVVLGNNDGPDVAAWGAPETLDLELEGLAVGMIHDSGPRAGRVDRLRRHFLAADLVIFGHSHIPMDVTEDDLRIFNPGSPTDKRRQPYGTVGVLRIEDAELVSAEIMELR